MGAPLQSGAHLLGLLAVASYKMNAFSDEDEELLTYIARQAALSIDNAEHHQEVEENARRDSLTQAYNHGYFVNFLNQAVPDSLESGEPIAVIMLDIDFFKKLNDTYGHQFGDQVLIRMSAAINSHIKKTDVFGRWGGEEFAVALPNANGNQALMVAERVQETVRNTEFHYGGEVIQSPTVSMGIAVCPFDADEAEMLIKVADQRLYVAKSRGRDQIEPAIFSVEG
jgi:diguanylate cyclase (GGDEF)-like protein